MLHVIFFCGGDRVCSLASREIDFVEAQERITVGVTLFAFLIDFSEIWTHESQWGSRVFYLSGHDCSSGDI